MIATTELRWFACGPLPAEATSWFTGGDARGGTERRGDRYLIDGRPDVGIKLRGHETLELKIRHTVAADRVSTTGPTGHVEVWHKWSPAPESVVPEGADRWIDVDKRIERRRFTRTGDEVALADGARSMAGVGCDVELVEVRVGGVEAWSFAFAAFGPVSGQRAGLAAAWRALIAGDRPPEGPWANLDVSCGYPQWLHRVVPGAPPT